jgi:galactose mutarotase-like enzyme
MGQTESGGSEDHLKRIVLESSTMRVTILPALGGKIASIQTLPDNEELLQQPLQPYAARTHYLRFEDSDASGWDECLPSVAACEVQTAAGPAKIPDHGDFWQVPWQVTSQTKNALTISADAFSLPLRFTRTLHLDGNSLRIDYRIRNLSHAPLEYLWSAHPLFAVDPGDRILLPASVTEVTVEGSAHNRLGSKGTKQSWPKNAITDFSIAGKITDETGDKLFAVSPPEGWCALERKRLKRRIELCFDPNQLPHLGLWLCYGGWPENAASRQQCVALEPCTAEGDSLETAMKQGRAPKLNPGAEDHWSLEFQVSSVL